MPSLWGTRRHAGYLVRSDLVRRGGRCGTGRLGVFVRSRDLSRVHLSRPYRGLVVPPMKTTRARVPASTMLMFESLDALGHPRYSRGDEGHRQYRDDRHEQGGAYGVQKAGGDEPATDL